jgi:ankyrin repeat protein
MQFLSLPQEIILLITSKLEALDLAHLLQTNKFLYRILHLELFKNNIKTTGGLAISFYAFWGYADCVQDMLNLGAVVDIPNPRWRNYSPLKLALSRHHGPAVRLLIDNGADVNLSRSPTPLELAILMAPPDDLSMIELLLDRGAKVNLQGSRDRTALFKAVFYGNMEGVALLLARGADVNVCERSGQSLLTLTRSIRPERAQLLLDMGAKE